MAILANDTARTVVQIVLAIVIVVLAFNLVGDGLRDALDPRMRKG